MANTAENLRLVAALGGRTRAERLSSQRKREIAQLGGTVSLMGLTKEERSEKARKASFARWKDQGKSALKASEQKVSKEGLSPLALVKKPQLKVVPVYRPPVHPSDDEWTDQSQGGFSDE